MNPTDFFAELGPVPKLDGARCKYRHELFDAASELDGDADNRAYAQRAALTLCKDCPALADCSAWFDSLKPSQRPPGVVAGRVTAPRRPGRPRRAAS